MPHVIVKLFAGRTTEQKQALADAITAAVVASTGKGADTVSVGIEDIAPADWDETVYRPDIHEKQATLFKAPGYPAPKEF